MIVTDIKTWLEQHTEDKIFSVWSKKEVEEEDAAYSLGDYIIVEAVYLPDNDILLGLRACWANDVRDEINNCLLNIETEYSSMVEYHKLSEIMLKDNHIYLEQEKYIKRDKSKE